MGFVWHVALRYFRSTRADAHIRTLSSLTAGGLALGTAALVLALAALSGFQNRLLEDLLRHAPALQVELGGGTPHAPSATADMAAAVDATGAADAAGTTAALAARVMAIDGVEAVQELLYARGWLADRTSFTPVEVVGYEQAPPAWILVDDEAAQSDAPRQTPNAAHQAAGVALPAATALRMGLQVGGAARLVSPRPGLTPVGPQPRARALPVMAVYESDRADFEELPVLLPIEQAAALFASGDRRLDLTLAPGADAELVAADLRLVVPPDEGRVTTWREANRALLFILRLEKALVASAVTLIVAVAAFALLAALSLVLSSKRSEIGALAAMGAPPARLQRVFLLLGAMLSVGGAGAGSLAGAGVATFLDRFRIISLPTDVYLVDYVPFLVRGQDVLVVLVSTVVFTGAAALSSARRASRLDPVEAMRSGRT